ncbi:hypothetical protein QAD02_000422 [Eretmocerus hayati]|uniref:Uncharacterized protein n=1 Tax=Eretmocerus hayati TaxID=131215 RepID=A0ACC2NDZ3_9HYME|nr:hypothetical protein QAD02_000422 [Eretmocerus hayati]
MKGHELLDWLLIYSIPILKGVLKQEYFDHWVLLVISSFTLLRRKIPVIQVQRVKILLGLFGRDLEKLYGDRILTYYMHQIAKHLADYVEKWGPLWANSAFGFESYNSFLTRYIHGTNSVGQELVNNIQVHEGYTVLKNQFKPPISIEELEFSFQMLVLQNYLGSMKVPVEGGFLIIEEYFVDRA